MGNIKGSQNEENSWTRSPRPSKVQFRVGEVLRRKKINAYGVIIG